MKMRKLLATAVAASLAVTSMATVASAAEKSWNMGHSKGTINFTASKFAEFSTMYALSQAQIDEGETLGTSAEDKIIVSDVEGTADKPALTQVKSVTLNVTGVKGTRTAASKTYSYAFKQYNDAAATSENYDGTGDYFALEIKTDKGDATNQFIPGQFVEITKMELVVEGYDETGNKDTYVKYGTKDWGRDGSGLEVQCGWTATGVGAEVAQLCYTGYYWGYADKSTSVDYPFMPVTEFKGDDKLGREEIRVLSVSGDYASDNIYSEGNTDNSNQSYEGEDTRDGEVKKDFAGLATQVADFFNKQTNGTITFKFTTGTEAGGVDWENGGIPSTQTGIKNFMGDATANDFALFINYRQTGSLQAVTELDKDAGTVTFDISDILDAMGGQTLGTIDNIYYGLRKGVEYDDKDVKGLKVETVTLAYDEDADVEADIEDDAEEEDDADVEIEEDDADDAEEEDADDAEEEDDADASGDVVVEEEDDDANPGTGVALAVVPAMVAAAAVVLSKKRK
ncbi:MAG: hypothetical protein J6A30_02075 [Ruminococcus sp.]|nr:hypothetical protein [Ruminococcus sp.]